MPPYDVENVVEVVGDAAGQGANAFKLLRLAQLLFKPFLLLHFAQQSGVGSLQLSGALLYPPFELRIRLGQCVFGLEQGRLCQLPLVNVDIDSRHAERSSSGARKNFCPREEPVHASIRPDHTKILRILTGLERVIHFRLYPLAIFRVKPPVPAFVGPFEFSRRKTIERFDFRRPIVFSRDVVVIENSPTRGLLPDAQAFLAFAQGLFGPFAIRDVADRRNPTRHLAATVFFRHIGDPHESPADSLVWHFDFILDEIPL